MRCKWFIWLVLLVPALFVGCSGSHSSKSGSGSATFTLSDTDPDILDSFVINIQSVDIVSNKGIYYPVFPSAESPGTDLFVDLTELRREGQILGIRNLPVGIYDSAVVTFTGAYATSGGNRVEVYPDAGTVDFHLRTPLVVENNGSYAVNFDMDLASSLEDGGPNLVFFNPVVFGDMVEGKSHRIREFLGKTTALVENVDSIQVEVVGKNSQGNWITVAQCEISMDDDTVFIGSNEENLRNNFSGNGSPFQGGNGSSLESSEPYSVFTPPSRSSASVLPLDTWLDIKAEVMSNGEIVARSIEVKETDSPGVQRVEIEGIVTAITQYLDDTILRVSILNVKKDTEHSLMADKSWFEVFCLVDNPPILYYETTGQVVNEEALHVGVRIEVEGEVYCIEREEGLETGTSCQDSHLASGAGGGNGGSAYPDLTPGGSGNKQAPDDPGGESPSQKVWRMVPTSIEIQEEGIQGIVTSVEAHVLNVAVNSIEGFPVSGMYKFKNPEFQFGSNTEFWVEEILPIQASGVRLGDDIELFGTFRWRQFSDGQVPVDPFIDWQPMMFTVRMADLVSVEFEGETVSDLDQASMTFCLEGDGSDFGLGDPATICVQVYDETRLVCENSSNINTAVSSNSFFSSLSQAVEIKVEGNLNTFMNPPLMKATKIIYELP